MAIDDLWQLYQEIGRLLAQQLTSEKRKLEHRLSQLQADVKHTSTEKLRRPYPKVYPKYQNPDDPSQTWSGRGKKPRWIGDRLAAGKSIEELLIDEGPT
jgi:DNA-binding protein H-NS